MSVTGVAHIAPHRPLIAGRNVHRTFLDTNTRVTCAVNVSPRMPATHLWKEHGLVLPEAISGVTCIVHIPPCMPATYYREECSSVLMEAYTNPFNPWGLA